MPHLKSQEQSSMILGWLVGRTGCELSVFVVTAADRCPLLAFTEKLEAAYPTPPFSAFAAAAECEFGDFGNSLFRIPANARIETMSAAKLVVSDGTLRIELSASGTPQCACCLNEDTDARFSDGTVERRDGR